MPDPTEKDKAAQAPKKGTIIPSRRDVMKAVKEGFTRPSGRVAIKEAIKTGARSALPSLRGSINKAYTGLGAANSVLTGLDEYSNTGSGSRAVTKSIVDAIGTYGGGALGGAATAIMGPFAAGAGVMGGSIAGSHITNGLYDYFAGTADEYNAQKDKESGNIGNLAGEAIKKYGPKTPEIREESNRQRPTDPTKKDFLEDPNDNDWTGGAFDTDHPKAIPIERNKKQYYTGTQGVQNVQKDNMMANKKPQRNPKVLELQKKLKSIGMYKGPIDGIPTEALKQAYGKYQQAVQAQQAEQEAQQAQAQAQQAQPEQGAPMQTMRKGATAVSPRMKVGYAEGTQGVDPKKKGKESGESFGDDMGLVLANHGNNRANTAAFHVGTLGQQEEGSGREYGRSIGGLLGSKQKDIPQALKTKSYWTSPETTNFGRRQEMLAENIGNAAANHPSAKPSDSKRPLYRNVIQHSAQDATSTKKPYVDESKTEQRRKGVRAVSKRVKC